MFMNAAYLTSVPVHPFTLYIIVVVCNPYLGVIVLSLFWLSIYIFKECYFKMLRLLVLYLHHTLVHLHVFSGREMFKSRRVNTPAQVPQLTIRQLENLAAERKRQSQRQRKKAKDR